MTEQSDVKESSPVFHTSDLPSQEKARNSDGVIQGGSVENSVV